MRQKTIQDILSHAAKEYPRECCGVIAQKSRVERYFPCRNLAAEPTEQFHLSPEDYAAAEDWGTITGIVHSHPDATTQPSSWTRLNAMQHCCPGILSVGRKETFAPLVLATHCH